MSGAGHYDSRYEPPPPAYDKTLSFDPKTINEAGIPKPMNILEEAMQITSEDRRKAYGHPLDNFTAGANIMREIIKRRHGVDIPLTPEDYGMMMLAVKLDRLAGKSSRDNLVDLAGYARCIEMVQEEQTLRYKEMGLTVEGQGNG